MATGSTIETPTSDGDGHNDDNVVEFPYRPDTTGPDVRPTPSDDDDRLRLRHLIGRTLREERQRQGRTLADVAEEAAVSLQYLSEVERGRKEISSDLLHAIHTALGLELADVLRHSLGQLRVEASAGPRHRAQVSTAPRLRAWPQSGRPVLLAG
ncbi:MAG: helix-turn-helix transcriptional regulator [Actinomycetota bacterium]